MGNCGSKELISSIKSIIEDKSQPLVVRTQAVFALRKIAKAFQKLVRLVRTSGCYNELTPRLTMLLILISEMGYNKMGLQ